MRKSFYEQIIYKAQNINNTQSINKVQNVNVEWLRRHLESCFG